MAKMTREEVEERLEEYPAYKAIKEAHEDVEESPPEIDDDSLENGVDNNSQNSDKEKEEGNQNALAARWVLLGNPSSGKR